MDEGRDPVTIFCSWNLLLIIWPLLPFEILTGRNQPVRGRFLILATLFVLVSLAFWMRQGGAKPHELISALLGAINLLVLGWALRELVRHASETAKMHQAIIQQSAELTHQVRFAIMPSFAAKIDCTDRVRTDEQFLFLWNTGNGSALNLRIDPVRPTICGARESDYEIHFRPIPYLAPGEPPREVGHKYIRPDCHDHPLNSEAGWVGAREMQYLSKERPLRITFQDIQGNEYAQVLRVDCYSCEPEPVKLAGRSLHRFPPAEDKSEAMATVATAWRHDGPETVREQRSLRRSQDGPQEMHEPESGGLSQERT